LTTGVLEEDRRGAGPPEVVAFNVTPLPENLEELRIDTGFDFKSILKRV
jgi:hypothetical protein